MSSQLLEEIWRRPTDRQVLGVYADWLAGHGETARAEYIQLSLLEAPTAAQEKRRAALLKKHRGAWLGPARPFVWIFEESQETPGFIARCDCAMAKLTAGFDEVRALGPRLLVSVLAPRAKRDVRAFAERPIGTLYGLALYEANHRCAEMAPVGDTLLIAADTQWVTDELLQTIAPKLDGLRQLVLRAGEARASEVGWAALLPHLGALEHLELSLGGNPERWVELLLASSLPQSLRTLSLPGWLSPGWHEALTRAFPSAALTFREESRMRFDRETGYFAVEDG
jgi:uncharacterized protein (TIGR02996 family)